MQPKFTLKKSGTFQRLALTFFVLFGLFAGKTNAQCVWSASTVYPINIMDQGTAVAGPNLYSFAGVSAGAIINNAYKFDGTTWTPITAYPVQVEFPGACSNGTDCYIAGGALVGTGTPQNTFYRYNVAANTYTLLAPCPTAVWNPALVYFPGNNKIYKIGGTAASSVTNVEVYDITAGTWAAAAPYPGPISFVSAWTQGNYIYAAGGYNTITATEQTKAYRYDPATNTWDDPSIADLPATRWGAAYGFYNGGGVLAGGYSVGVISNTAVIWDPLGNSWSALPVMLGNRARMTGGVLGGNFYAIGGRLDNTFNGTNINQKLNCPVLVPCAGTPNPGNTISSVNPVCPNTSFTLSMQNNFSGVTYQWEKSTSGVGGPWSPIAGALGATYTEAAGITVQTAYRCQVTCTASSQTGTSNPLLETIAPVSSCYCIPTYSNGCTLGDYIANVTLGTLNNTTACSTPPYTYYSAIPAPQVFTGASNQVRVTVGPDTFGQNVGVWIDYNQDGTFQTTEMIATPINAGAGGTAIINFTVPGTATLGTTRMRVRGGDDVAMTPAQSCGASNSTFGEAEDYNVNLVPCIPVTFVSHPANATIACGDNATFTVTTNGSLPTYQWEYRVNAASAWQLVPNAAPYSGITTNTLTLSNVPQSYNGYQFRAIASGACSGPDFSNPATLTVNAIVPVVVPSSATICLGAVQQLTLTNVYGATATVLNEGFDVAPPPTGPPGWNSQNLSNPVGLTGWFQGNAGVFASHSGAGTSYIAANFNNTAGTGTISNWLFAPMVSMKNGDVFKFWTRKVAPDAFPDRLELRFSTNGNSVNVGANESSVGDYTNLALTINPSLVTGVYPTVWTEYTYTVAGVSGTVNGRFAFRYYVTGGGPSGANSDYIGIDDASFTTVGSTTAQGIWGGPAGTIWNNAAANIPYTGVPQTTVYVKPLVGGLNNYTVSFSTPTPCTSATLTIPINVSTPIPGVNNPANRTACVGGSATFTASATGGSPLTYQWELSTDGGLTYAPIAGATSASYTQSGITLAMNNYRYRLVITAAPCGSQTTAPAILTVNALPNVVITSPDLSITPGQTTTINGTSTPAAVTWSWTLNGSVVPAPPQAPFNTASIPVGIDALGTYQATVTDVNGCTNTSNTLTIGAEASEHLWIYPNPNNGTFQIRLYYDGNAAERRIIRIYNSIGQLVAQKEFDMQTGSPTYQRMDFSLPRLAAGPYVAKVTSKFSGRIVSGVFIIAQ